MYWKRLQFFLPKKLQSFPIIINQCWKSFTVPWRISARNKKPFLLADHSFSQTIPLLCYIDFTTGLFWLFKSCTQNRLLISLICVQVEENQLTNEQVFQDRQYQVNIVFVFQKLSMAENLRAFSYSKVI